MILGEANISDGIASINFGMLEKSTKDPKEATFCNALKEACYYRGLFGGKNSNQDRDYN